MQLSGPTLLKATFAYAGRDVPEFPCELGAKRPLTRNGVSRDPDGGWPRPSSGCPDGGILS